MKHKTVLLLSAFALAGGVAGVFGVTSAKAVTPAEAAIVNGNIIGIEKKAAWTGMAGSYQLEFADGNETPEHTKLIDPKETVNSSSFLYYKYNSADFDFTPTYVRVTKNSKVTNYLALESLQNTIWVEDDPNTVGGGSYTKDYTPFTVTATFNTAAPEGQQIYIGSELNSWGWFDLSPNNDRTVYSASDVYVGELTSMKYKLLNSAAGDAKGWSNVISTIGETDKDGNYSATLSEGVFNLTGATPNAYFDPTQYTITEKVALDSVVQGEAFNSYKITIGDPLAVPARPYYTGYHFGGWYKDEELTKPFTEAFTPEADTTIYAKFTTLVNDSYIYYFTESQETCNDYVYTFGGDKQYGNFPGKKISEVATEVHGVITFNGKTQNIFKIPYSSTSADDTLIINNGYSGGENQTSDMVLVNGSGYYFSHEANYHNDDAGAAIAFLLDLEQKRNAVEADEDYAAYSLCGISGTDAANLYNTYFGLSNGVKGYVNNSYIFTYNGADKDPAHQVNVDVEDIITELRAIAVRKGENVQGSNIRYNSEALAQGETNAIVITVICAAAIAGIGLVFAFRRRRTNEQ